MSLSCCLKTTLTGLTLVISIMLSVGISFASGDGDHHHSGNMEMTMALHQHKSWQKVPAPYAGKRYKNWNEQAGIALGKKLYGENCLGCHGRDGRGKGEMAAALAHPPADLTNHFHCRSGKGDDYMFWRISEGGEVEPFVAMGSAMPAFKDFVSEKERWAILSYVHASFHAPETERCQEMKKEHGDEKKDHGNG